MELKVGDGFDFKMRHGAEHVNFMGRLGRRK
jgi:hypothetical protein